MIAWVAAAALAGDVAEPPRERRPVDVVLRGMIERWEDPALATVYASGVWAGGAGLVAPVIGPIDLDVELAFARLKGEGTTFEVAPLSLMPEIGAPMGPVRGYLGLGPTWTVFGERVDDGSRSVTGARIAAELRAGLRADTGLVRPPMAPANAGPVRRIDVEIYVGRRSQLSGGDGFHLGAWRASAGLALCL
ncbi:MAG: hypothetical protein KC621_25075 [Myxococcales bacterium]|nr:hypothetical protein [Myxococcales bacterium]